MRKDGLSNKMAIDFPARGLLSFSTYVLERDLLLWARSNSIMVSLGVISVTDRKSRLFGMCRSLGWKGWLLKLI